MVSFNNEESAKQIYERRHDLEYHTYLGNVYIMRDLPRSERGSRRSSNTMNEAANSGGNGAQENLRGGNGSLGNIGNGANSSRDISNRNSMARYTRARGNGNASTNNASNGNSLTDIGNADQSTIRNENSEEARGDGESLSARTELEVHETEDINRVGENDSSEQQTRDGDTAGEMGGAGSSSGNEEVGEQETGS